MNTPRKPKREMPPRPELPEPAKLGSITIEFNIEPDGKGKWRYYFINPWIEPGERDKIKSLDPADIVTEANAKLARMANRQSQSPDQEVIRLRLELAKLHEELQSLKNGPVKELAEIEALPRPAKVGLKEFVTDASAAQGNLPPGMTLTDAATDVKRSRRFFTPTTTETVMTKLVADRKKKNRHPSTINRLALVGNKLIEQHPGKYFHELSKSEFQNALDTLMGESSQYGDEKKERTRRDYYDAERTISRFAYSIDAIPEDQIISTKKMERPKISKKNPGEIYPVNVLKGILAVCETPRQLARVAIPAFGGPRASELFELPNFQLVQDGRGRIIGIAIGPEEAKGYDEITTARVFPIRRNLSIWLDRLKDTDAFSALQDPRDSVQKQLAERLQEEGITWIRNALRRSNESYAVALTGNEKHVAAANGHGLRVQGTSYLIRYVAFAQGCEWFRILPADATPDERAWVEEEIKACATTQNADYRAPVLI
jgi:hypothetical protein